MKPLGLLVVSKEAWEDRRWARKQWLPYYLSQRKEFDRIVYLDRHCGWWRGESPHPALYKRNIEIRQERLLLPLERCSLVRSWNRKWIASRLTPLLGEDRVWAILFYHPFDMEMMEALKQKSKIIFDWTEDWATFHDDPSLEKLQRKSVEGADVVLTVTSLLRDRAIAWRGSDSGVFHVPNATALETSGMVSEEAESIRKLVRPRIGFIGHAGPWFDEKLVAAIVRQRPDWQWIMVGGCNDVAKQALSGEDNVHWQGAQSPDQLLSYMQHCDVLVAPYRRGIEGDATKLYDYLVAGKPIVSTVCETAEMLQPWVKSCDGLDAWLETLDAVLSERPSAGFEPCPASEIKAHHWRARAAKVSEIIREIFHG
ncbi:MAG: glycosyltransferase [Mariprofundaceae bacterium]|nr:glycosyltransferase [Mariprofundaceae bacterium]